MASASIHVQPVQNGSESHNERTTELDYTYSDLSPNNASWSETRIADRQQEIEILCKEKSGRKLQKNSTPIREAVVNLEKRHTMPDLKRLTKALEKEFGIQAFQIHIHRDEGKSRDELNYHAHILFDWQNKQTGKMLRLGKLDTVRMQTITADVLGMERGKEKSTATRLSAQQYKISQEIANLKAQKKNLIKDIERKELQHKQDMRELKRSFKQEMQSLKSPEARVPEKTRNLRKRLEKTRNSSEELTNMRNEFGKTLGNISNTEEKLSQETKSLEKEYKDLGNTLQSLQNPDEENILSQPKAKPKKKRNQGMGL